MPSSKIAPADAGAAEAQAPEQNDFQKFLARGQYEGTFLGLCHSNPTLLEAARVAELDLLTPDELAERSRQRHAKLRAEAEAFQSKIASLSEEERADPKCVATASAPLRARARHRLARLSQRCHHHLYLRYHHHLQVPRRPRAVQRRGIGPARGAPRPPR